MDLFFELMNHIDWIWVTSVYDQSKNGIASCWTGNVPLFDLSQHRQFMDEIGQDMGPYSVPYTLPIPNLEPICSKNKTSDPFTRFHQASKLFFFILGESMLRN